jgi:hypothetical protein
MNLKQSLLKKHMADAVDTRHRSLGCGYLKIVTNNNDGTPTCFSHKYIVGIQQHYILPSSSLVLP